MIPKAEEKIVAEVSKWDGVVAAPHSFGGTEFRLGRRELGHVHADSWADIAFSMEVRNQLVEEKRAQPHHMLPKSGWITFRFREDRDVERAIELFRLSYDIAKKKVGDPNTFLLWELLLNCTDNRGSSFDATFGDPVVSPELKH